MSVMVSVRCNNDLSYRNTDCLLLTYAACITHYVSIRSCEHLFYIQMNKMACQYVSVLPPQIGNLFTIYEVPKNAITQL